MSQSSTVLLAVRAAKLLSASPEAVYSDLTGVSSSNPFERESDQFLALEKGLLLRSNPLITLAIGQTTCSLELLRKIYDSAVEVSGDDLRITQYKLGLRTACLGNSLATGSFLSPKGRGFLSAEERLLLFSSERHVEQNALIANPGNAKLLIDLLSKAGEFKELDEEKWCEFVCISASNERLNIDDSNRDGPDMVAWDIKKSLLELASRLPITKGGAITLVRIFERCRDSALANSKEQRDAIVTRWNTLELPAEANDYGWRQDLTREVMALIGAVIPGYWTKTPDGKNQQVYLRNAAGDLPERAAAYAVGPKTLKQAEEYYNKDGDEFVLCAIKSNSAFRSPELREFIEDRLTDRLRWIYQHHRDLVKRKYPSMDLSPRSESLREEQAVGQPQEIQSDESRALESLIHRVGSIEAAIEQANKALGTVKAWGVWIAIGVIALLIWKH